MMAFTTTSSLSLVVISSITLITSGQVYVGPGYLACPLNDVLGANSTADSCISLDPNCTEAQFEICSSTDQIETTDPTFTTLYIPLPCDCVIADGCPESCEFNTGNIPVADVPNVTGFVNFTEVGNLTCPFADLFAIGEESCFPVIADPASCGTCNTTYDDALFDFEIGVDTSFTIPILCDCIDFLNCPNTCTFVASDSPPVAEPIAAPVAAPTSTDTSDVTAMPIVISISEPTSENVMAPTTVTAPVASAPVRSPVRVAPTATSMATTLMTGSYNVMGGVLTIVFTMMYVVAM